MIQARTAHTLLCSGYFRLFAVISVQVQLNHFYQLIHTKHSRMPSWKSSKLSCQRGESEKTLRKMRLWHIQRLPRIRDYDMNNLHDIIPCAMPVKRASQEDYSLKPVFFIRWSEHVYFFTHQVFYVYFFGHRKNTDHSNGNVQMKASALNTWTHTLCLLFRRNINLKRIHTLFMCARNRRTRICGNV